MRKELKVIAGKYDLEAVIEEVPTRRGGFPVISFRHQYLGKDDERRYAYRGFSASHAVQKELRRLSLKAHRWAKQYREMKEENIQVAIEDDNIVW